MRFKDFAFYLEKLERTASRNKMTEILADLFKKASKEEIAPMCYLLQGRIVPLYTPLEFGMATKMAIRAAAYGLQITPSKVLTVFKSSGDLGAALKKLEKFSPQLALEKNKKEKSVLKVYKILYQVARTSGAGSQEEKIKLLGNLLAQSASLSRRYLIRMVLGKLRLGFSDMTILDALSWFLTGDKSGKKILEKAYNVRPDLGFIAKIAKGKGLAALAKISPQTGTPIRMSRANRLSSAAEILEKIGRCAIESKYDGLRLQVHKEGEKIKMFSRNLEEVTAMFPDVARAVSQQIKAREVIFEGELVAYNPKTGVFAPFQETMQRKRKYEIEKKAAEIPVKLFAFELLYKDGKNFLEKPYLERKKALREIIGRGERIVCAPEVLVAEKEELERLFEKAVEQNFEGIIAKKLRGTYEAGMRGWNWIKYKKAMNKKLADTIDVLVMGYTKGEGKRTAFGVGQFLTGVYDEKKDKYVTATKIGTGLTDEQFREFSQRVKKLEVSQKPALYEVEKILTPDKWLRPKLVVEVSCDEITRSPVHTAGRVMQPSKSGKAQTVKIPGYALRFPRLERFRDDKSAQEVTTVSEISQMFKRQR